MMQLPGTDMSMFQPPVASAEEEKLRRINMLTEMYDIAARARQSHEARWQRDYEMYFAIDTEYKKKAAHQSKIVVPLSYQIIETAVPQLVLNFLSQDPIYSVNPQSNDDPYKAKIAEGILNWQTRQMKNVILEYTLWVKDAALFGHSVAKTGWDYKCEHVPRIIESPPMLDFSGNITAMQQLRIEKVVTADNPIMRNVDIGEIYIDPTATCMEDAKYVIHRMMVPFIDIKKMGLLNLYQDVDKVQYKSSQTHWASQFAQRRFSTTNMTDPFTFDHQIFDYVEVLECWYIDPTDPYLTRYKTVIANRSVVLQDVPLAHVYWHNRFPFVMLKDNPMTNELYSVSSIDMSYPLQKELNSLRNQRMDNTNAVLKAFWLVNRSSGVNKEKIKRLSPGDILMTNDINGVRVERPPTVDNATFGSEQSVMADIQRTTGFTDTITGMPSRSQLRNATTAQIMDTNSKTRLGLKNLLYLEQFRRVGQDFLALDMQYLTPGLVVRILGEDGLPMQVPVNPADIPRNPDVFVTLATEITGNKELRRQQIMQLDTAIASTPMVNLTLWRKDLLREFGFKNPERYFEGEFTIPTDAFTNGENQTSSFMQQAQAGMRNMPGGSVMPMADTGGDTQEGTYSHGS